MHSSDSSFSDNEQQQDKFQTTIPIDSHGRLVSTTTPSVIITTAGVSHNSTLLQFDNNNNNNKRGTTTGRYLLPKRNPSESSSDSNNDVQHHKLTREDSERPIASEKIKKKSNHAAADREGHHSGGGSMSILSVFRYYTDKIRHSASKKKSFESSTITNRGYVQQQLEHDGHRHRKAQSYAHFLNTTGSLLLVSLLFS